MRTSAPDLPVAPAASWRRSSSTTLRTPRRVRWKAVLVPLVPPPTTTMSAVAFMVSEILASARQCSTLGSSALDRAARLTRILPLPWPLRFPGGARPSPKEVCMSQVSRRELLKGAAALGAAAAVTPALGTPAAAQTTQKRELVIAQGGDIAFFDPHMS